MSTLLQIRTALNAEVGVAVADDATDPAFTLAVRNQAIADAYADLWRAGVWKDVVQSIPSVNGTLTYALTSIRALARIDVLDSSGNLQDMAKARVELTGAGTQAYQLRLAGRTFTAGWTIKVYGWGAYASTFANDAAVDDLPAEFARIPRLKAKAILYDEQRALFARYGERQVIPPSMNLTLDQLDNTIARAEAQYAAACKALAGLRPRSAQIESL